MNYGRDSETFFCGNQTWCNTRTIYNGENVTFQTTDTSVDITKAYLE